MIVQSGVRKNQEEEYDVLGPNKQLPCGISQVSKPQTHLKRTLVATAMVVALALSTGCRPADTPSGDTDSNQLKFVVTTGHIHDALTRITEGTDVELKLFCGPGVDPHSFSASTGDVKAMEAADAIFYNGFHLEAKLTDLLHGRYADKSWSMASAFPETERMDWKEDGEVDPEAPFDPHIWHHLESWAECTRALAAKVGEIDPANADLFQENGERYVTEILELHEWTKGKLSELPEDRRFLVSAHDAFNYFARAYGLETVAVLGVGNDPEADIQTMREVSQLISDRKVPVIFMESITNPKVTAALKEACESKGWNVEIADSRLYSDDLGEAAPHDTFLGAFRANVENIYGSLKP